MCPKPNHTASAASQLSHVEDLPDGIPQLFDALTAVEDIQQRWMTVSFPVDLKPASIAAVAAAAAVAVATHPKKGQISHSQPPGSSARTEAQTAQNTLPKPTLVTVNCTVVYLSQCMSWNKCKESCSSMGAASYRWFHDTCCECVGHHCINYGINESRCSDCSYDDEEDENEDEDILLDDLEDFEALYEELEELEQSYPDYASGISLPSSPSAATSSSPPPSASSVAVLSDIPTTSTVEPRDTSKKAIAESVAASEGAPVTSSPLSNSQASALSSAAMLNQETMSALAAIPAAADEASLSENPATHVKRNNEIEASTNQPLSVD